ncbi:MAG: LLM class F420-dependent oxidoreductase [Solirubrobacterales bacterium]
MATQRWGLTISIPGLRLGELEDVVRRAEAAGYTDFWTGETQGPDGFTPLALASTWTKSARLATGVVGVFQRGPALLAMEASALADASEGRFVLGIGSSSNVIVERWNGFPFEKPLTKVSETVDYLRAVLAGERGEGGFKLEQPPEHPAPIVVGALRGKMLALAAEKADGAMTNFLPLSGLPAIRDQVSAAGDGFELVCRFFCLPGPREQVEATARWMFAAYATVPVYTEFFRWLGHGDAIEEMVTAWGERDRERALAAAPWELIEETFILGEPDEMRAQIQRFIDGGVTMPTLVPITEADKVAETVEALAP